MDRTFFEPFVDAIRRELEGKTQTELADELGIPQQTISAIVRGETIIGIKTLQAILMARPSWIALIPTQPQELIA